MLAAAIYPEKIADQSEWLSLKYLQIYDKMMIWKFHRGFASVIKVVVGAAGESLINDLIIMIDWRRKVIV